MATAAGVVVLLSKSVELNTKSVGQSLYHYKYDWKAWLSNVY